MICQNNSCSSCGTCLTSCGCKTCGNNIAGNYPIPVVVDNFNTINNSSSRIITNNNFVSGAHFVASGVIEPMQDLPLDLASSTINVAYQNIGESAVILEGLYKIDFSSVVGGDANPVVLALKINGNIDENSKITLSKNNDNILLSNSFFSQISNYSNIYISNLSSMPINIEKFNMTITKLT